MVPGMVLVSHPSWLERGIWSEEVSLPPIHGRSGRPPFTRCLLDAHTRNSFRHVWRSSV